MSSLSRVLIFGGTHGNEWTGIKIVEHYQNYLKNKFQNLELEFILANPEAFKLKTRYKDEDLNRAFQHLNEQRSSYESQRAREILNKIHEAPCFVIDLHTTTSNMGNTLIVSHYNAYNLGFCAQLGKKYPLCRVIGAPDPKRKYLVSQSDFGVMIEVGPVANNIISATQLESTLDLLEGILTELSHGINTSPGTLEMYEEKQDVYYPQDEKGNVSAYIHSDFQGKDFQKVEGKYRPFKAFQGGEIELETPEELYPIFINEAAYYPQQLAFTLCQKKLISYQ
jgi:aspartoacylase